jgi:hypothetical protein
VLLFISNNKKTKITEYITNINAALKTSSKNIKNKGNNIETYNK